MTLPFLAREDIQEEADVVVIALLDCCQENACACVVFVKLGLLKEWICFVLAVMYSKICVCASVVFRKRNCVALR